MGAMMRIPLIAFLILPALVAQAGDVDFANYDKPLYAQIVGRIKAKVQTRLGEGKVTKDRYFIIPFAYQNEDNNPEFSHSFLSVIRVFANNKPTKVTPGLMRGIGKGPRFELFTLAGCRLVLLAIRNSVSSTARGPRFFPIRINAHYLPGRTSISKIRSSWR